MLYACAMAGLFPTPLFTVDAVCGAKNSVDYTLICAKGGYVALRHNALRDLNADLQREVCKDVIVEPKLLPLENEVVDNQVVLQYLVQFGHIR